MSLSCQLSTSASCQQHQHLYRHLATTTHTMYKVTILLVAIAVSCTVAAPTAEQIRRQPAVVHEEVRDKSGQYSLQYVTAEGTVVVEKGRLVPRPDGKGLVMVVEGEVRYIGDDGKMYKTEYTAGLDGYRPVGAHLPVAPAPVPAPVVELAQPAIPL